ncbi:putative motility protein YjfB-like [Enterobacter sp. BIGb0383]|uniref:YjfB family protein n=1 Tax=unclassified Enterobacter TaxID=2608935 RepID=UPI000F47B4B4|nr:MULTISPECIES: YjfB family protein [unclassified Enterobacter]ROP62236.1 putative motility protein YjfB-like [Enterobacter sp. BIGb0383]ROS12397.1 putative motility protein YjfB-like [Enterobacter sp. BIGb0359]
MDVTQIPSMATSLEDLSVKTQASTLVLKKALENQQSVAAGILESIPQLPSNPAIGRNINTTA